MYFRERNYEDFGFIHHNLFGYLRQEKMRQQMLPQQVKSALTEGLAVGALILSGVDFVGAHQDTIQRAVVLAVAVVCAGLNSTFDGLVSMAVHKTSSFYLGSAIVWQLPEKIYARGQLGHCIFFLFMVF